MSYTIPFVEPRSINQRSSLVHHWANFFFRACGTTLALIPETLSFVSPTRRD
jgi:hypothetical protein